MTSGYAGDVYCTLAVGATDGSAAHARLKGTIELAPDHRQAAEDIEADVATLYLPPRASRLAIEGCWGAAFHWIAFGCETKHGQHRETHIRLGTFLRNSLSEPSVADWWEELERLRQGGWYGGHFDPNSVQRALTVLGEVRSWAMS